MSVYGVITGGVAGVSVGGVNAWGGAAADADAEKTAPTLPGDLVLPEKPTIGNDGTADPVPPLRFVCAKALMLPVTSPEGLAWMTKDAEDAQTAFITWSFKLAIA